MARGRTPPRGISARRRRSLRRRCPPALCRVVARPRPPRLQPREPSRGLPSATTPLQGRHLRRIRTARRPSKRRLNRFRKSRLATPARRRRPRQLRQTRSLPSSAAWRPFSQPRGPAPIRSWLTRHGQRSPRRPLRAALQRHQIQHRRPAKRRRKKPSPLPPLPWKQPQRRWSSGQRLTPRQPPRTSHPGAQTRRRPYSGGRPRRRRQRSHRQDPPQVPHRPQCQPPPESRRLARRKSLARPSQLRWMPSCSPPNRRPRGGNE